MKSATLRALGWDALFQVLDNWVFRILAVLALVPILASFLLGFREDEVVFLFGLRRWDYDGLLRTFGGMAGGLEDAQGHVIQAFVQLIFAQLVGTFGVLFCIAATAFFVPRMIEKGAADVLFHKPIGRLALYLSRYCAGLLFVGLLSVVLVVGTYLGILLVSGYNDPGILFGALSLTYLFGLVYSVCMLIGTVTRSTVASILLSVLFFAVNGCAGDRCHLHFTAGEVFTLSMQQVLQRAEYLEHFTHIPFSKACFFGGYRQVTLHRQGRKYAAVVWDPAYTGAGNLVRGLVGYVDTVEFNPSNTSWG